MNFERDKDIKEVLGLGGIDLQKKYDETVGEWKKYYSKFIGKRITFHVNRFVYCNWDDRIASGELVEVKTMLVDSAHDDYSGHPGCLYFLEKGSGQCWFVDMTKKIYLK
jgi:hypothetical protein